MELDTGILKREEQVVFALRSLYHRYGYGQYKMSKFEEYDLYGKNKDFLISGGVITFTDTNGRLMALKPDVTLSIVKSSRPAPGQVQKVYYNENVYRISKSSGSFKEIMQAGLECIGDVDDYCLAEVLVLAGESLRLISDEFRLSLSHAGIVENMLDALALDGEARRQALRCLGEKNLHELEAVCAAAGCEEAAVARLKALSQLSGSADEVLPRLTALGCDPTAVNQLRQLSAVLAESGLAHQLCIDFSVLGDMRYYNGITFKGYVRGVPESVISGGQYDKLLRRMGKPGRAVGFAVYLDLLERLDEAQRGYDADTVLLYETGADPAVLSAAVRSLQKDGSVLAVKAVPEDFRYRRLMKLTESGVAEDA
ncbi:MAG: ATP phosphoribosyltransferase regulatory subunit [Oscillospiraceae bacterium]|nr:ATP phosphoribosyltransferase regulatory subunit [Oscillospiraceae bacterium]